MGVETISEKFLSCKAQRASEELKGGGQNSTLGLTVEKLVLELIWERPDSLF